VGSFHGEKCICLYPSHDRVEAASTNFVFCVSGHQLFKKCKFFFKIYLFILERQRAHVRESTRAEEGVEGENPQADCLLSVEPDAGLDPMTHEIMT